MAPFDVTQFHALLRTKSFGRNLIFEPTVGSTMDVARDAALSGATEGTVALADEQTAGRGRLGRSWITPPATNIAATLLLRPATAVLREIAMIAPLAVCHAVEDVAGLHAGIKWPNDVQVTGKKLAGILIETDVTAPDGGFALVGTGINVNFDPRDHEDIRDIATSLVAELGGYTSREALLASYLAHFERLYAAARSGESPRLAWRERLVTLGQNVRAAWEGGSAEGIAENVDADGALLIRAADGTLTRVEAGDVTLRG